MARSRKSVWLRDELILALDLYQQSGRKPSESALDELSATLRSMPIEPELAVDPGFRSHDSMYYKLANFASLDPAAGIKGLDKCGLGDRQVWDEFADDPARLKGVAAAIRANLASVTPTGPETDDEIADAPEGKILTRAHRVRERNRTLVARKKREAMEAEGRLACATCAFDFAVAYGSHGEGFIECHHTVPVSQLTPGARTRLADLALVCANCHRMIHRRAPWLSLPELAAILRRPDLKPR